jgi:hypothetical protein
MTATSSKHFTKKTQYTQARVVVEHESKPWTLLEFESLPASLATTRYNPRDGDNEEDDDFEVRRVQRRPPPPIPIGSTRRERIRGPRCECRPCKSKDSVSERYISAPFADYDSIDPNKVSELTDHQALLCMSHMFGFILKDRAYGQTHSSLINELRRLTQLRNRRYQRFE